MFVHNKHLERQILACWMEPMTAFLDMGALGCKSANERYAMILSGREKAFLGIWLKEAKVLSVHERALLADLREFRFEYSEYRGS